MRTRTKASPYQIAAAFRISRAVALEIHQDTSGSVYERDVFGQRVTYDTATGNLTDCESVR